ncbi:TetR/AcrR family transcriptional regulator [Thioclava kandeliae]|uniref:Helix-turn-helix domain-containing protein n=1 Tax=Thioclava kandeliae TaxID=3070818 RepID=A0ABV1SM21_9RHOB
MPKPRAPRSDGLKNQASLLKAAEEAFVELGVDVSVAEIARRAGVGKGTVFRHFATKEDLLAAVVVTRLQDLIAEGRARLDAPDSAKALYDFLELGAAQRQQRGLSFMQDAYVGNDVIAAARSDLLTVLDELVERAKADGELRKDVNGGDVALLMCAPGYIASHIHEADETIWRRYLAIIFDGLRPESARALPGHSPGMPK